MYRKISNLIIFALLISIFTSCSTRKFIINSSPDSTLIIQGSFPNTYLLPGTICGQTPIIRTNTFMGKKDMCYFTAMKRGYEPDTILVSKDSATTINFDLIPIEGAPTDAFNPDNLIGADFYVLPVAVNIVLHKGVGNLDKYEDSEELSKEVTESLSQELNLAKPEENLHFTSLTKMKDHEKWTEVSDNLKEYLLSLNPALLPYYGLAPSVIDLLEENQDLLTDLIDNHRKTFENSFLVYVWCKSIKTTTGRIIGNLTATVASGVVSGYETATYGAPTSSYDPDAFSIDNSSLYMAFVIDPENGEVLYIKQQVVPYDIVKPKYLKEFSKLILNFPDINKTP